MENTGKLNTSKLSFVGILIVMISAGVWLGLQWSPTGFTLAGRYGFTGALALGLLGGIIIPMAFPQVRGAVLGALLGGLGLGMAAGMFLPGLIAKIPPDALAAIVESLGGGMLFGQDWGLGPILTIFIFLIFLGAAYFLGLALTRLTKMLHDWLHS